MDPCGREAQFNLPYFNFPTGSINTTIMELGPKNHNGDGLSGLNSIIAVYMDPLGFDTFELADVLTTFRFKLHCLEALIRMTLINITTSSKAKNRVQPLCETLANAVPGSWRTSLLPWVLSFLCRQGPQQRST